MGTKRKRVSNQKATRRSKRFKLNENEEENVKKTTLVLDSSGEVGRGNEEDELMDTESSIEPESVINNNARAKANAAMYQQHYLLQHNTLNGDERRGNRLDSSDEDQDKEVDVERTEDEENATPMKNSETRKWTRSTQGSQNVGGNLHPQSVMSDEHIQLQRSPQLARRPMSGVNRVNHPFTPSESPYFQRQHFAPGSGQRAPKIDYEPESTRNPSKPSESKSSNLPIRIIIAGVVIIIAVFVYDMFIGIRPQTAPTVPTPESFVQVLEKLDKSGKFSSKFANQNADNWRKVRAAVKATTALALPRSPGVIAIVAPAAAEPVASCMGRELANKLKDAYGDSELVSLRGIDYKGRDEDKVKTEIDQRIRNRLENGSHVVLLEGLHHLPANSGLLFHGLCDTDNAPYKQAIFIFTSITEDIVDSANQQVTTFWKDSMTVDKRQSLETRIGNNIIVVNPEKDNALYKDCS